MEKLGYLALTKGDFNKRIANFYEFQTGIGTNILLMTVISFVVGLSISGQTFYTFILENLDKFGALKAMGAKGRELVSMILFQAAFTGLTGYGLGVGLCVVDDLARAPALARLCSHRHLSQSRARLRHGPPDRRGFELHRRAPGAEDRAVRGFP